MSGRHDTLARACERALVTSALAECVGSRQRIRAAARSFMRRHRRDADYLRFVLRSVGASSTLAVALLGLGPEPANAKATLFTALGADPLVGQDAGVFSTPAFGDLDGDGDPDLVAGARLGGFAYFENTGSATGPAYVPRTGAQSPLGGQDVGLFSAPALGDLDDDGDLDLLAGEQQGGLFYFENTGNAASPTFVPRTGAQNPLDGLGSDYASAPVFADLDDDGDLDLVAGDYDGAFRYFENTGSATSAAFVLRTGAQSPLAGADVGYFSTPAFGDLDGDGDLDLVSGMAVGEIAYFENTGSAASAGFAALSEKANPGDDADLGGFSAPTLGDLDGDGDLDLVTGEPGGGFASLENQFGRMVDRRSINPRLNSDTLYGWSAYGDLDGDGDLDLVHVARFDTVFQFHENTGSATNPAWIQRTGSANPLNGINVGSSATPALADLDDDGDLDLVAGTGAGTFAYLENTGSASSAAFVVRTGAANPLDGQDVGSRSTPALADLDGDGDFDLLAGEETGTFRYFENTGTAASAAFIARTGAANPLDGVDLPSFLTPALGDLDGDGDVDLVAGTGILFPDGRLFYFENTGSTASPVLVQRTGAADPFAEFNSNLEQDAAPALADLDGDGDLDITTRTKTVPRLENAIVQPTSSALLPEPRRELLLGAGVALVSWLGRLRRGPRTRSGLR